MRLPDQLGCRLEGHTSAPCSLPRFFIFFKANQFF